MKTVVLAAWCLSIVSAQVTYERLLNAAREPHNWLTYNGSYSSTHHSALSQIRPENVDDLQLGGYGRLALWRSSKQPRWSLMG